MKDKQIKFNETLQAAKRALDSIDVPFHLMAGTALGAHREKSFIPHDEDIDLAVFYKDVNTNQKIKEIKKAMIGEGFIIEDTLGRLQRGKEILFIYEKYDIHLDIFWVYEGFYKGKDYYIVSSYFGQCDALKYKTCVWAYRPYDVIRKKFLGKIYNIVPRKTLIDMYGKDWKTPKIFNYEEGIKDGGYKGFVRDYYEPKIVDKKIAYCFVLKEEMTAKTAKKWIDYFNTDNFIDKEYVIYALSTNKLPGFLENKKVRSYKDMSSSISNLLKKCKDADYVAIIADGVIPLFSYWDTHKKIKRSKKSRVDILDTIELSFGKFYISNKTMILTKEAVGILTDTYTEYNELVGDNYLSLVPVNTLIKESGKQSIKNCDLFSA